MNQKDENLLKSILQVVSNQTSELEKDEFTISEEKLDKLSEEDFDDVDEEKNMDVIRKIVAKKQNAPVKMKDGQMKVDLFTASAVVKAMDHYAKRTDAKAQSINKKLENIINTGTKQDFVRIANVIFGGMKKK